MTLSSRAHLRQLESESIFLMREVAAQFERPVLLCSGGKDSRVRTRCPRRRRSESRRLGVKWLMWYTRFGW